MRLNARGDNPPHFRMIEVRYTVTGCPESRTRLNDTKHAQYFLEAKAAEFSGG
jgi:hypothetical protein